jgi:hypothetical protein
MLAAILCFYFTLRRLFFEVEGPNAPDGPTVYIMAVLQAPNHLH